MTNNLFPTISPKNKGHKMKNTSIIRYISTTHPVISEPKSKEKNSGYRRKEK